ncbi:hypothetical protein FBU30_001858 [Linnemannia zychae]|nr:hypothetical protein FBU30_001858 [Linnemannia zychae]
MLFRKLRRLVDHRERNLSEYVSDMFEGIKDDTRLLVIYDEAQLLGDQFNGSFQSVSSSDESPRPLLSPILHPFREIGQHLLTLVTCRTGSSINTLFWVQSSGSDRKDSSTTIEASTSTFLM